MGRQGVEVKGFVDWPVKRRYFKIQINKTPEASLRNHVDHPKTEQVFTPQNRADP